MISFLLLKWLFLWQFTRALFFSFRFNFMFTLEKTLSFDESNRLSNEGNNLNVLMLCTHQWRASFDACVSILSHSIISRFASLPPCLFSKEIKTHKHTFNNRQKFMSNNQSQANLVIWISQTHFIQTKEMIYILFIIYSDFDAIRKSKRI